MAANGLIWWSTPRATCGLVVADGVVVDCPPYAAKVLRARGRDARDLWREQFRAGADLDWLPDQSGPYEPPAPDECRHGHRYGPNLVLLGHRLCHCEGAARTGGHRTFYCRTKVDGVECGDLIAFGCTDPTQQLVAPDRRG